jgi:hypothetical protein
MKTLFSATALYLYVCLMLFPQQTAVFTSEDINGLVFFVENNLIYCKAWI